MNKNNFSLAKTMEYISEYLDSSENIITSIYRTDSYNDYPFFYHYMTEYLPRQERYEADLLANGISLDKNEALIKAVMETIERWYLSSYSEDEFIFNSYIFMSKHFQNVLDPNIFRVIADEQLNSKEYKKFIWDEKTSFYWTEVNKLSSNRKYFIPAQLMYFMHKTKHREPFIRLADSTGAAAGISLDQAIYQGVCELIERDAYTIMYYNKLPGKRVILDQIKEDYINSLIEDIQEKYFTVYIFEISLDIQIPVFLCVLVDETKNGPKVSIGVKCSLYWQEAMYGAIMEALQGLTSTRDLLHIQSAIPRNSFINIQGSVQPILERVLYWAKTSSTKGLDFLLSSLDISDFLTDFESLDPDISYEQRLKIVTKKLNDKGVDKIYWKKITPQNLDNFHLYGVKVVIPQLQLISLDGRYHYFGNERLFTIPVKMKLRKTPSRKEEMNTIPHPLP